MAHSPGTHPTPTVRMVEDAPLPSPSLSVYITLSLVEPAEDCVSVLHSHRNEKIRFYFSVTCLSSEKNKCKICLKIVKQTSKNKGPQIASSHLTVKDSEICTGNKASQGWGQSFFMHLCTAQHNARSHKSQSFLPPI